MIRAYVYSATSQELLLLEKILTAEGFGAGCITDLCYFSATYNPGDDIITFGQRARSWCVTNQIPHLSLPPVQHLLPQIGYHEARLSAHQSLVAFRKVLDIKEKKEKAAPRDATGITAEGLPINFSNNPDKSREGISMTYRELDLMNLAVGVLGIKDFSFVRDSDTSSKNSN